MLTTKIMVYCLCREEQIWRTESSSLLPLQSTTKTYITSSVDHCQWKKFLFCERKVLVQCELLSTRTINIYRSGFLCCTSTRSLTLLEHRHLEQSPQLPVSRLFPNFCFSLQGLLGRKIMFSVATDTIYTLVKAVLSKFSVACWQSYSPDTATLPCIQYVPGTWYLVREAGAWYLLVPWLIDWLDRDVYPGTSTCTCTCTCTWYVHVYLPVDISAVPEPIMHTPATCYLLPATCCTCYIIPTTTVLVVLLL